MRGCLEAACQVWWSENVDPDDVSLKTPDTPEKILMAKEALEQFSGDAKLFVNTLINLPDDFFTTLGKPIKNKIIKVMQNNYHWTAKRTNKVQSEITMLLR